MQTHHDLRSISGKMRRKIEGIEYSSKIADKKQVMRQSKNDLGI